MPTSVHILCLGPLRVISLDWTAFPWIAGDTRPGQPCDPRGAVATDDLDTLPEAARSFADDVTTRQLPPRATVFSPLRGDARGRRAIALLEKLAPWARYELRGQLGEGGMSVVHDGVQTALGRAVAIKVLREGENDEIAVMRMLREAWVTGSLEHPNIVPMHDISLDANGKPLIVMRKIAGTAWDVVMHDDKAIRERFGARDVLDWNIRILMQVSSAVHFAHSRGILHRDIKSGNVMIGPFGEVYLLDWGLAVSLADDGSGRLPLASEIDSIAGTPAYMAPEMLQAHGDQLSVRTDVYLLGGVLHEIVAGFPPHMSGSIQEVLRKALRAYVPTPDGAPPEMAALLSRALAKDPAARFESAEALRLELSSFLEHRASAAIARDAYAKLRELEAEAPSSSRESTRLRAYHLFGECRFGFKEALNAWPENAHAKEGLTRAVRVMVDLELAEGDARAAQMLVVELEDAPGDLSERVQTAVREHQAKAKRYASMERDLDPRIGRGTRLFVSVGLGVFWTLLPLVGWFVERGDPHADQKQPLGTSIASLIIGTVLALRFRHALSRTALNRSVVRGIGVVLMSQIVLYAATLRLGVAYEHTRVLVLFLYAMAACLFTVAIEKRLWPTAAAYVGVALVSIVFPPNAWLFEVVSNAALTLNVLWIWRREDAQVERASVARR